MVSTSNILFLRQSGSIQTPWWLSVEERLHIHLSLQFWMIWWLFIPQEIAGTSPSLPSKIGATWASELNPQKLFSVQYFLMACNNVDTYVELLKRRIPVFNLMLNIQSELSKNLESYSQGTFKSDDYVISLKINNGIEHSPALHKLSEQKKTNHFVKVSG